MSYRDLMQPDDLIVVAGGGGFIGGHLVARLAHDGYRNIRAVDIKPLGQWYQFSQETQRITADLREPDECLRVTRDARWIFNFAADMGGMGFIESNKALCMLSVLINTHLLMAAVSNKAERYLYASSACVYNVSKQTRPDVTPLREEDAYPAMPEDGYGWEKLFSERLCRHFTEDFGLATRVARYHNVYGPLGTWIGGREKAPAAICRKVALAQLHNTGQIEIWGDGKQTRSFTYIDDCIEGTLRLFGSHHSAPLNIGSDELVSIDEMVSVVEGIASVHLERVYDRSAPKGVRGRNSDNTRICQILGWKPSTPLVVGLESNYRWIYDRLQLECAGLPNLGVGMLDAPGASLVGATARRHAERLT